VSSHLFMVNSRQVVRSIIFASLLSVVSAASVSLAYGQFTLSVSALRPVAGVDPGGSATATIDLEPVGAFDSPIDLTCQVTSGPATASPPVCTPSPATGVIPPADGPSLTITTTSSTVAGTYQLTVTGTSSGVPSQIANLSLNVADLTQAYLLSVSPTTASPSPVPAGSSATTTVTITALGNYTGNVTLACLSITPIVVAAPYCSFNPAITPVTNGVGQATLTITTFGQEVNATNRSHPRIFYGLWLAVPGLALVGMGATRKHRKKLMGIVLLLAASVGLLLLPSCGTTVGTTARNGQITPDNTYSFALTGADQNGAAPTNIPPSVNVATVTLQVTKAN
jgi:hypothetical protein